MEFWSNKVRKQYKGVAGQEAHIAFCDQTKAIILDLTAYTKEYHFLGLAFNPKGCASLEEGAKLLVPTNEGTTESSNEANANSTKAESASKESETKQPAAPAAVGIGALMSELANKRTSDGSSAATGLKKVTKDQQTWRKEFNSAAAGAGVASSTTTGVSKANSNSTSATAASGTSSTSVIKLKPPVCEFDKIGQKWKVEYQTKESNAHLKLEVKDVKEQVYIYKCSNMTVEVSGKLTAVIVDGCTKVNVVFGTAISGFEVVNSKRIQVQTLGVCPTISIDKTDGCMVYLSKESMETTSFMTSKSSEMNGKCRSPVRSLLVSF
jgi:adenylyl cyclase-associated protein